MIFIGSLPLYFNSRPSARGDPVNVERKSFTPSHFNSRPSARGDVRVLVAAIIGAISIHAPPRGATLVFCSSFAFCPFQFTPLREGRRYTRATSWIQSNFNSRPSARGDANVQPLLLGNKFQFTPLREGRQRSSRQIRRACYFNSRPSARGDSTKSRASSGSTNFNSRPSARGDFCSSGRTWVSAISIHAPPRGATRGVRNSLGDKIFQFTPLREGRRLRFLHAPHSLLFQFTPLREGRRGVSVHHGADGKISIHAPPRGATRTSSPL